MKGRKDPVAASLLPLDPRDDPEFAIICVYCTVRVLNVLSKCTDIVGDVCLAICGVAPSKFWIATSCLEPESFTTTRTRAAGQSVLQCLR